MRFLLLLCFCLVLASNMSANAAEPKVVVSIKPLHSLVQGVMGDTGEAILLVNGNSSPHEFQFKPSQVKILYNADVIFYIDETMESFLIKPLESLPDEISKVAMMKIKGMTILNKRKGGEWEGEDHHDSVYHDDNHDKLSDPHIWLDIGNAKIMVAEIAKELGRLYPRNKNIYDSNAVKILVLLDELDSDLRMELAEFKNKPFIVYHDAYQYFENRYNLKAVGSVTIEPGQPISAKRITEIRNKIKKSGALCVFREPQFSDKIIGTIIGDDHIKSAILDPLGARLQNGTELYFKLLENLAGEFGKCVKPQN